MALPITTSPKDWKWKAENFVRWVENGLLFTTQSRVKFLSEEYDRIYQAGVSAGITYAKTTNQ